MTTTTAELDSLAIENFRQYVRIPSISNATDYEDCVKFLKLQAANIQLECTVVRVKPTKPIVIIKWQGTKPELPSISLNSHMDVVPVEEDNWTYPPFAAHMDQDGKIFGRGTQDMKFVGIQYLETIRRLKLNGVKLARTIVVTFVPDEEIGGQEGMKLFVQTPEFQDLNIGFGLDESNSCSIPKTFVLLYAEKHKWSVKFHITGDVGHGCLNLPNTAAEKLSRLLKSLYDFRDEQYQNANRDEGNCNVASLNVTVIQGGQQENVIPSEFVITVDIRLPPLWDIVEWKKLLDGWCQNAGEGVWIEENICEMIDKPTALDSSNPFYQPLVDTVNEMGFAVLPQICFAVSDARFLRNLGIPTFGLSFITGECLIHKHNECIDKKDFLNGINIYYRLLIKLGNLETPC